MDVALDRIDIHPLPQAMDGLVLFVQPVVVVSQAATTSILTFSSCLLALPEEVGVENEREAHSRTQEDTNAIVYNMIRPALNNII